MVYTFRNIRGRWAAPGGYYLDDLRGSDDYDLREPNGKRSLPLRWRLVRRTPSGKVTHEVRFWRHGQACVWSRRFKLTLPQACDLAAGRTVRTRTGATLRITKAR